jgi:membrane-bound serine protease (ClpP class)
MGKKAWSLLFVVALFLGAFFSLAPVRPAQAQEARHVDVLTVDDAITPVVADYLAWGIAAAREDGAAAAIVLLNTPGGMLDSTWEIVGTILNAEVPVVVYVYPRGARAASAGVYITYAAHVAAMAPNTRIGAATPVAFEESGLPVQLPDEMQRKLEEDALAGLRASAQERGRNMDWAERAVREGVSATDSEAKELGVVEIVATDLDDLLRQLDGRTVKMASGQSVQLQTAGAVRRDLDMPLGSRVLAILTVPTVAYILFIAGLVGLWVEFSHPGVSIPGVLGGVSLLLSLYGLSILPVNWVGVLLIVLAFVLFAFDLFAPSHFVLTTGGIAALVAGSLLLFNSPEPALRVEPWVIALVAVVAGVGVVLILVAVIRGQHRPVVSGSEAIVGLAGVVRRKLDPEGLVFADGALWRARAENGPVAEGEQVQVVAVEGLVLRVRRATPGLTGGPSPSSP